MSTLLLTPTHIASDHCVVTQSIPVTLNVDINHSKIFIPDHKQFLYALVGDFEPGYMRSSEIESMIEFIVEDIFKLNEENGFVKPEMFTDNPLINTIFPEALKDVTDLFVVTHTTRHVVYYSQSRKKVGYILAGDYASTGTGGYIGKGLLLGGMDIHDIWPIIHEMVPTSSIASTIIPLSILKPLTLHLNKEDPHG